MKSVFFAFFLLLPRLYAAPLDYEKVVFKNRESLRFSAYFHAPERNNTVFVLLHGLGSAKEEWLNFGQELNRRGYGWLAYDARGHGDSSLTRGADGAPNGYKYLTQWDRMIDDVGAAVQFLENDKGIKRSRLVFMGASLGANVVLNYAALTRSNANVILLSPGLNYQEIKMDAAVRKVPAKHLLLVAHPGDAYSFSSCTLTKEALPAVSFWFDVRVGHGVQMLDPQLTNRLIDWLHEKK